MMIVTVMIFNLGMKNIDAKERRRRWMWNCAPFDAPFERYERRKTVRSSRVPSRVGARRVRNESPTRASPPRFAAERRAASCDDTFPCGSCRRRRRRARRRSIDRVRIKIDSTTILDPTNSSPSRARVDANRREPRASLDASKYVSLDAARTRVESSRDASRVDDCVRTR